MPIGREAEAEAEAERHCHEEKADTVNTTTAPKGFRGRNGWIDTEENPLLPSSVVVYPAQPRRRIEWIAGTTGIKRSDGMTTPLVETNG